MRNVALIGSLMLVGAILAGAAAAPSSRTHLAYVSVQRIAAQTEVGQAMKRLESSRQEKNRALTEKQQKLETLRLELAQSGGLFSRSRHEELRRQEEKERAEFERLRETSQTEIQNLQREIQTAFQNDLKTALADLAAQRDADIVVNSDTAVVWARPGFDLTDEAIKRIEALEAARKK